MPLEGLTSTAGSDPAQHLQTAAQYLYKHDTVRDKQAANVCLRSWTRLSARQTEWLGSRLPSLHE